MRLNAMVLACYFMAASTTQALAHLHPGQGRFVQRDPAGYLDGANLMQYVRSDPLARLDPTGLVCPKDKCDEWEIEANGAVSMVVGAGFLGMRTFLKPTNRECCIDFSRRIYDFNGFAIGGGIAFSINVGGEKRTFTTPCIRWDDHVGSGRITVVGLGVILTFGHVYLDTPQTYQHMGGWGWGVDASAATSVGQWFFGT